MDTLSYKTVSVSKENAQKDWIVIDATDQIVGRLAARIAMIIRGKHKASFTPHADTGDNVIVINAEKVRLTGKKFNEKEYVRHTGYPGGQRTAVPKNIVKRKPEFIVENAVRGMLPKNRLGSALFRNLYVYAGNEHPHEAQQPKQINLDSIK